MNGLIAEMISSCAFAQVAMMMISAKLTLAARLALTRNCVVVVIRPVIVKEHLVSLAALTGSRENIVVSIPRRLRSDAHAKPVFPAPIIVTFILWPPHWPLLRMRLFLGEMDA